MINIICNLQLCTTIHHCAEDTNTLDENKFGVALDKLKYFLYYSKTK